jgi:hypothetical protein
MIFGAFRDVGNDGNLKILNSIQFIVKFYQGVRLNTFY